jgi:hypothetical protein
MSKDCCLYPFRPDNRMSKLLGISDKAKINQGGLTISRSIGDFHCKLIKYGGIPNMVIPTPDILSLFVLKEMDFIVLATAPLYERLTNNYIALIIFQTLLEGIENDYRIDLLYSNCLQNLFKTAIEKGVKDTLSCVILFFESFITLYENKNVEFVKFKIKTLSEKIYLREAEKYYNYIKKVFTDDEYTGNRLERSVIINNNINNNNNNNINIIKETKFYCCGIFGSTKSRTMNGNS